MPFRQHIASVHELLQSVSEQSSELPFREGGWSRRQILGHLIDSALNNHQRSVRAALEGAHTGPAYQQDGWVAMHGYKAMSWATLTEHWRLQNELLCEVVERIPADRLAAECRVGDYAPMNLGELVEDYLVHLDHHVGQIIPNRLSRRALLVDKDQ